MIDFSGKVVSVIYCATDPAAYAEYRATAAYIAEKFPDRVEWVDSPQMSRRAIVTAPYGKRVYTVTEEFIRIEVFQ